jgi:hypothetical protein
VIPTAGSSGSGEKYFFTCYFNPIPILVYPVVYHLILLQVPASLRASNAWYSSPMLMKGILEPGSYG